MKKNCTLAILLRSILVVLSFISSLAAFCQPDYDFRNPSLVSGTDKQIGAVYLFQNVKTGVDAKVTVINMTGGVTLNNIDGGSGYIEALQPIIDIAPLGNGYVEFKVDFVVGGTNTPMVQVEVPVTPIDVDGANYGDGIVREFDQLKMINGYANYDMLGGQLSMNLGTPWVTGTNLAAIDYPGIDTSARQVMFTVVNGSISSFTFRSGAISTSLSNRQRLRSVYFKKFIYANAFLSTPSLVAFNGSTTKDKKVALQWNLAAGNPLNEIFVERSFDRTTFTSIADVWVNTETNTSGNYSYKDNTTLQGVVYYRLKMINARGEIQYSNVLVFHTDDNNTQAFKMYPSVISDNATVNISATKNEQTSFQVVDLNGRSVYQKSISLQEGNNNVAVNGLSRLPQGIYVAVINTNGMLHSQKIMIR